MAPQSNASSSNSADNRILSWIEREHEDSPEEICSWTDPKPRSDDYDMNWVDPDPDPEPTSFKYEVLPIAGIVIVAIIAVAICAVCITSCHLPSFSHTLFSSTHLA